MRRTAYVILTFSIPLNFVTAKVMDAVERAGTDVLQSTSNCTQDFVTHRYEFPFSNVRRTSHFALCGMEKIKKKRNMDV